MSRSFALLLTLVAAAGCAGLRGGRPVTKIVHGRVISTRPVSPQAYEHVTRAYLYEEEGRWEDAANEIQRALAHDDDAPELRAHLAELFMRMNRLDDAADQIAASMQIEPTIDGWIAAAHLREAKGDEAGAVEPLRRAAALTAEDGGDPEDAERVYLDLLDTQVAALDPAGAYDTARALLRADADTQLGRRELAALAWALGKPGEAEVALEEALAEEPDNVDARLMLGQLRVALGRADQAKIAFREAIDRAEDPYPIAEAWAHWLVARGEMDEAGALADKLGHADDVGEAAPARARLERAAKRSARARAIAEKAIKRGEQLGRMTIELGAAEEDLGRKAEAVAQYLGVRPELPEYLEARLRAAATLRDLGRLDEAARALDEAEAALRTQKVDAADAEIVMARSQIDEKRGDSARAARRLEEALQRAPDDARLVLARAAVEDRRGDWRKALAIAEALLAKEPRHPSALNFAGFVAVDHGHDLPRALARVQAAMVREPGSAGIIDSVGWAHFKAGDLDKAALFLEQAGRLEPGDPEIMGHRGDLYAQRADKKRAVQTWRKALTLDPEERVRRDLEERVRAAEAENAAKR